MSNTEWNEAAQLYQFWWGLRKEIKDELAHEEALTNLDAFVNFVIHVDNRLNEQREEEKRSVLLLDRCPLIPVSNLDPEPMQLDSTHCHVTPEEKASLPP